MSGDLLSSLSGALSLATGWRVQLRPGSFRGVPFFLNTAAGEGGRRLATHEFPQRDIPSVEDLGQKANRYNLQVFVVGGDYMVFRDALLSACQDFDTAATLVHPTLGSIQARAGQLRWTENPKDLGGYCAFDVEFHKEGVEPGLFSEDDTVGLFLNGLQSLLKVGLLAYVQVSAIVENPALLFGFAGGLLGDAAASLLGIPIATIAALGSVVAGIAVAVLDDTKTGTAVQTAFEAASAGAIAARATSTAKTDAVLGAPVTLAPAADITGGLISLATWGDRLAAPSGAGAVLAARQTQQAAIVALVEGAATVAVLTVYANTAFASTQAAAAARTTALALVDRQIEAAGAADQDDLCRAWMALAPLAIADMIRRAQALPDRVAYALPATRPSLVLGSRWYDDPNRAEELELLNDAPHPMFMPAAGVRLSA